MTLDALDPIETTVLAHMLSDRYARDYAIENLGADAFTSSLTALMFGEIARRLREGRPVAAALIAQEGVVGADALRRATARAVGMTDIEAIDTLRDRAWRRRLAERAAAVANDATDPGVPTARLWERFDGLRDSLPTRHAERLPRMDDLVADHADEPYEWLIPDVLERRDRLILVGRDGHGKTTMLRQLAYQAAAGVNWCHPERRQAPLCVLMVDAENSPRQIARSCRRMVFCARRATNDEYDGHNLAILSEYQLDLNAPMWRDRVESQLEVERPDIMFLGPLYKVFPHTSRLSFEEAALEACHLMDRWRERFGVSIVLEAHSSKGGGLGTGGDELLDPRGSGVWRGWPEFGRFLAHDRDQDAYRFGWFRGDRDYRDWPVWWFRNASAIGWPWVPCHDDTPPPLTARERDVPRHDFVPRSFDEPDDERF